MLNGSTAPRRPARRGRGRAKAAPVPPVKGFDAEALAVARALFDGIQTALGGGDAGAGPTPVQLKDLATAARTAQAVGQAALGADAQDAPGVAARAIAGLLGEIDGGTRGLPDGS